MLLAIDQSDQRPLYEQLAASVRGALTRGELWPGDPLPATREAAGALGVNAETIQRAYRLLADEGLVVSRVGRGTRVRDDIDVDRLALDDAIADLIERAIHLGLSRHELVDRLRRA